MSIETYWLVVPLVGIGVMTPVLIWLWLTNPSGPKRP